MIGLPEATPLGRLAERLGGSIDPGAEAIVIGAVGPIESAAEGALAPLLARRYLAAARASRAALLVDASLAPLVPAGRRWIHPHAAHALALLLGELAPPPAPDERSRAVIEPGAIVDPTASIAPGVVIRSGAVIGPGARVEPNAVIYGESRVGARVVIGAGAVIGRPGFGWTARPDGSGVVRVPQLGGVVIDDDAEIGALATVDAGTLGPTVIGRGAKLDAHVHVGHNATIGPGAIVAAQAGFAGSVEVGAGVLVGGQAGVADHVRVGAGAKLAAKAGVIGDVPAGATFAGYPAVDRARWLRATAYALKEGETAKAAPITSAPRDGRAAASPEAKDDAPSPLLDSPPSRKEARLTERVREPVTLDIHQILSVLPHRFPFVMVDRVTEILPGKSIRGHKCVAFNEPWFPGHFPQRPIMPGVLILESLAQIGGILAYASDPFDPTSNLMFFLGIDKAKFRHTVTPGDKLDLHVEVIHHRSNVWKLRGEASVDGALCAEGELLASIVDRQP